MPEEFRESLGRSRGTRWRGQRLEHFKIALFVKGTSDRVVLKVLEAIKGPFRFKFVSAGFSILVKSLLMEQQ